MCGPGGLSPFAKASITVACMSLTAGLGFWTQTKLYEYGYGSTEAYFQEAAAVRAIKEREIEELRVRMEAEERARKGAAAAQR